MNERVCSSQYQRKSPRLHTQNTEGGHVWTAAAIEHFLAGADDLIVSTVCAHLDVRSLRAVAQSLRPFRQFASRELPHRVVKRLGDARFPAVETMRMLLLLKIMDEEAIVKLTAPLVELLLLVPRSDSSVRACRHPAPTGCQRGSSLCPMTD